MKKLDLSMIPIDLKVGEEMEVLTPKGDKVTVRCVWDKRNDMCEHCFFGENGLHICSYVKCDSVSYQEVVTIQAIPRDTISCNGCAFRKGDLESMCKAYLCFSERTLDCLVFKKVKEKFK